MSGYCPPRRRHFGPCLSLPPQPSVGRQRPSLREVSGERKRLVPPSYLTYMIILWPLQATMLLSSKYETYRKPNSLLIWPSQRVPRREELPAEEHCITRAWLQTFLRGLQNPDVLRLLFAHLAAAAVLAVLVLLLHPALLCLTGGAGVSPRHVTLGGGAIRSAANLIPNSSAHLFAYSSSVDIQMYNMGGRGKFCTAPWADDDLPSEARRSAAPKSSHARTSKRAPGQLRSGSVGKGAPSIASTPARFSLLPPSGRLVTAQLDASKSNYKRPSSNGPNATYLAERLLIIR